MDDQQHALSALLRTIPIAAAGRPADPDGDPPSALLWAAALLLAAESGPRRLRHPARAGEPARCGIGRAHRRRRLVAGPVAALGGALGGLFVCAAAAAGDPLLDALDVSEASFRLAAGIVAAVAGIADLFRRPPSPEPALPGWRAAVIPVAIPAVARPALLVMAVGAGADRSLLVTVAAMVAAVALLVGLTAWRPTDGPRHRALDWARRVLATGLVAAGVLLAIDGILDV